MSYRKHTPLAVIALVSFSAGGVLFSVPAGADEGNPPQRGAMILAADTGDATLSPANAGGAKPSAQRLKARERRKNPPFKLQGAVIQDVGFAPPDALSKLIALGQEFEKIGGNDCGVKFWQSYLDKYDTNINENDFTDTKFLVPLVVGARICDGVMAVRVKGDAKMSEAANDIENLARKLGVNEEDLAFAKTIRNRALAGEWLEVYTNLSLLQNRVNKTLRNSDPLTAALVMTGGWMRAAVYVGSAAKELGDVRGEKLKAHPTYFMREPEFLFYLADQLAENRAKLPARAAQLAVIESHLDAIGCLIDIESDPTKGKISGEGLEKILVYANEILKMGFDNK